MNTGKDFFFASDQSSHYVFSALDIGYRSVSITVFDGMRKPASLSILGSSDCGRMSESMSYYNQEMILTEQPADSSRTEQGTLTLTGQRISSSSLPDISTDIRILRFISCSFPEQNNLIAKLSDVPKLQELEFEDCLSVNSLLKEVSQRSLPNITSLSIINSPVSGNCLQNVGHLAKLKRLTVKIASKPHESKTIDMDQAIRLVTRLKSLEEVTLPLEGEEQYMAGYTEQRLTARIARLLARSTPNLRLINIRSNQVGDQAVQEMATAFPALEQLELTNNRVRDTGAIAIGRHLHRLTNLYIGNNFISEAALQILVRGVPHLKQLNFSDNHQLTGQNGVNAITRYLGELQQLHIGGAAIGNEGARAIAMNLTRLTKLEVFSCVIEVEGLSQLARIPQLRSFVIRRNSLMKWTPQKLKVRLGTCRIN